MFAKLGALALYASAVSAMTIALGVDVDVKLGGDLALDVAASAGDATYVSILLKGPDVDMQLLDNVEVGVGIQITIPDDIPAADDYVLAAIEVGTTGAQTVVYAETDVFAIEAA